MPKFARGSLPESGASPPDPMESTPPTPRDRAIDVFRGLCIVSMTTAHLAAGSWPWRILHLGTFVDGAVGFVFLSGLVLGITQRRALDRGGLWCGMRKLLRRIVLIYTASLALCLLAVATVAVDPARGITYPSVEMLGGPLAAAGAALSLRFSPHTTSILSLYVVLMLLAVLAVAALARWRPWVVLAGSVLLYVVAYGWPTVFLLSIQPGVPGPVNWGTWQLLFMTALVVGWNWLSPPIRWVLTSRPLLWTAGFVVLALSVLGWRLTHGSRPPWATSVFWVFTEGTLAPGTLVMALAAVLVGYRLCRRLVRDAFALVSPLARIGRRSLDCYLILSGAVIVLPSLFVYSPSGILAVLVTFDALVTMYLWCLLRDRLQRRHTARAPAALAATAPTEGPSGAPSPE